MVSHPSLERARVGLGLHDVGRNGFLQVGCSADIRDRATAYLCQALIRGRLFLPLAAPCWRGAGGGARGSWLGLLAAISAREGSARLERVARVAIFDGVHASPRRSVWLGVEVNHHARRHQGGKLILRNWFT